MKTNSSTLPLAFVANRRKLLVQLTILERELIILKNRRFETFAFNDVVDYFERRIKELNDERAKGPE